jgi:hypothetical protein
MAAAHISPFPPRLSISRLSLVWDVGVTPSVFVETVLHHYTITWRWNGHYRWVWIVGQGPMRYLDYGQRHAHLLGEPDYLERVRKIEADEILLSPVEIDPELCRLFDVPAPVDMLDAWRNGEAPAPEPAPLDVTPAPTADRPRGRPPTVSAEEIRNIHANFAAAERRKRGKLRQAAINAVLEKLGLPTISEDTIARALGSRKNPPQK